MDKKLNKPSAVKLKIKKTTHWHRIVP